MALWMTSNITSFYNQLYSAIFKLWIFTLCKNLFVNKKSYEMICNNWMMFSLDSPSSEFDAYLFRS
jgi:hypothetical protein